MDEELMPVIWIGPSRRDLKELPEEVQDKIGRALQEAQHGSKPVSAKVLTGFHGASVLEIRTDYNSDTYRAIYTVRFARYVYVLHTFQKKSKHGIQTSKQDIDIAGHRHSTGPAEACRSRLPTTCSPAEPGASR